MQEPSESDLRTAWKWTVGICLAYGTVMTLFVGLIFYNLSVSDAVQAKLERTSAQMVAAEKVK